MQLEFNDIPTTGWYPGHMLKAGRKMREALQLIDLVVELVDARLPYSSRNPKFRELLGSKPALVVANKTDLADPKAVQIWIDWFHSHGETVFPLEARNPAHPAQLVEFWKRHVAAERKRRGATRPLNRPIRIMIAGIPNVGKSTLVNRLNVGKRAQVGPKPGVTRHNQWIPLQGDVELLDTPGVLWPRVANKEHELRLALIGSIRDEVISVELMAEFLWYELAKQAEIVNWNLYDLDGPGEHYDDFLRAIAARRGLLRGGGAFDYDRTAKALLKDYRDGRLGLLTFELPPEEKPVN